MSSYEVTRTAGGLPQALYRPPEYTPDREWPLIVFLHGAGERGADGRRQTTVGLGPALERDPQQYPALIWMPQCPPTSHWSLQLHAIEASLDELLASEPVDRARVSVTGVSMGGHGAVALAARAAHRYAAVAPVCGWADAAIVFRLATVPMWIFHGAQDDVVPVEASRDIVRWLRQANNPDVQYTEYPGLRHNAWDAAYAEPGFAGWLLTRRRG